MPRDNDAIFRAGLWKLPEPWTQRTRPPLLGNHKPVPTSFHSDLSFSNGTGAPRRPRKTSRSFSVTVTRSYSRALRVAPTSASASSIVSRTTPA